MAKQKKVRESESVYGVPGIPDALRVVIEHERENIGNALVVLQCLGLAIRAREGHDSLQGPFFPLAVQAVVEMLDRTVNAFDPSIIEAALKAQHYDVTVATNAAPPGFSWDKNLNRFVQGRATNPGAPARSS